MAERPPRTWSRGVGAPTTQPAAMEATAPAHGHQEPAEPDRPLDSEQDDGWDWQPPMAAATTALPTVPPMPASPLRRSPTRSPLRPGQPAIEDGGQRKHVDYRMDPAPVWGGEMPEKNFKEYQRNLALWLVEAEARIPHNLIGKRIIDSIPLGSKLSATLAHLTVEEICASNGHKMIVQLIEESHEYLRDVRLEQAFDEAIFRGRRDRGQPITSFLTGKKAAFAELKKQGLDLLASTAGRHLLGHLILRQGSFSQDQRQRLKVVTNGSIDYKQLETAIQKVFGDKLDEASSDGHGVARRWRSSTFWENGLDYEMDEDYGEWDDELQIYVTVDGEVIEDEDIFVDLICLNEAGEAQIACADDLPMVIDECDALEFLGYTLENIFYETRDRLASKGKGKGKKGKGKGFGKHGKQSYPGFGGGKGGGYLEHRRLLQASRNGRGYDKPWHQRQGSKLSIDEVKARTRCHQCKQIGHWSRDCPQRGKPAVRSSNPGQSNGTMSTGFFVEPPQPMASFGGNQFLTTTEQSFGDAQYVQQPFVGLSFVFLGTHRSSGTALVDTAAQHGLVGMKTLEAHDQLLKDKFGLQVQWSHESGGSVRGVCGAEETTKIAYVPIGLGGKSGALRVQVVPGDIPFLLPAYFLTDLEAVIDMKHAMIMYMAIGVKQKMVRLHTGHVAVSIIEFGNGFHVPANFAFSKSRAWSSETVPDWSKTPLPDANVLSAMGPLAALVAAAVQLSFLTGWTSSSGGASYSTTSQCPQDAAEAREVGTGGIAPCPRGTASDCRGGSDFELYGNTRLTEYVTARGQTASIGMHHGKGQVPDTAIGAITTMPTQTDEPWSQPHHGVPEVFGLRSGTEDAPETIGRPSPLEFESGIHAAGFPQAHDQQDQGNPGHSQRPSSFGSHNQSSSEAADSREDSSSQARGEERGEGRAGRLGQLSGAHRRGGCGNGGADAPGSFSELRWMPHQRSDLVPTLDHEPADVEVCQPSVLCAPCTTEQPTGGSPGSSSLPRMPWQGNASSERHGRPDRDGSAVHEPGLQLQDVLLRDAPGLCQDGSVQHHGTSRMSGFWLTNRDKGNVFDETFYQILDTLKVDCCNTYVAIGYGDCVQGVSPVTTSSVVSRRVTLTKNDGDPWNAVDVTYVPGETYDLGMPVHYVVLYEFDPDFVNYLTDAEFETETSLPRSDKLEISKSLDEILGDLTTYWNLWEQDGEPDDIVEVFGSLPNTNDAIVELYSPPRVVKAAAARGLKASLSIDLSTGYDLSKPEDRDRVRAELKQRRPRLLVTSPPCTKFSMLQNLRSDQLQLLRELGPAIQHVDFSIELLEDQIDRGDHGLHEHPDTATSWDLPRVRKFLENDEVILIKGDQCRFGLKIKGRLSRKSTLFATTCDTIAVNLQLCNCSEPHQPLVNGLPRQAQEYPPALVKAIVDGLIQEWVDDQQGRPKRLPDLGYLNQWIDELYPQQPQQWREFHGSAILVVRKPQKIPACGPGHRSLR